MANAITYIVKSLLIVILFFIFANTELYFPILSIKFSLLGIAGGFSLAILLFLGLAYSPIIAISAFITNYFTIEDSSNFAIINTLIQSLVPILSAFLLKTKLKINLSFSNLQETLAFLLIGIFLAPLFSMVLVIPAAYLIGISLSKDLVQLGINWWLAYGVGVFVLGTFLVFWTAKNNLTPNFLKALRRNSELLNRVSRISKVGGWELEIKTLKLTWTDEVYHIYELELGKEISLEEADSFFSPSDQILFKSAIENAIKNSTSFNYDLPLITAKGNHIWINIRCSVYKVGNQVIRLEGIFQDITEQKKANEKLEESKEQLRLALNGADLAIWDWDFKNGNLSVNERWLSMLGLDINQKPNLDLWSSLVHPEDIPKLEAIVQNTFLNPTGHNFEVEVRAKHSNGNYIWILDKGAVVERDEEGNPKRIIGTHKDITNEVFAKEELKNIEERFRDLVNSTDGIVWEADAKTFQFTYVSQNAERILGYSINQWFIPNFWQEHIYIEDREKSIQLCASQTEKKLDHDFEYRFVAANGKIFWLRDIVNVILENGEPKFLRGLMVDISNRKSMESEFMIAKERLEHANQAKSEFIANMSHELRTPLNAVIGFSDLLMNANLNNSQKHYMRIVFQSGKSLLGLLNNILDFSKIDENKLDLNLEKVDLFELIQQTSEILELPLKEKKIKLIINLPDNLNQYILADQIRLRQILINLLSNSMKFTLKGQIVIKIEPIEFNVKENKVKLLFSVTDSGIGIAKENLSKIFQAFSQVDSSISRKYGGAGLGLTISQKLLKVMGSNLEVKSELGVGSTFSFELETKFFDTMEDQIKAPKEELPQILASNQLNTKYRILSVDDDPINIFLLRTLIKDFLPNAILFEASNGMEAIEICKKELPDLILMDVQMPEMNGLEATLEIRNLNFEKRIPIIAVTAGIQQSDKDKCFESGMNDFASKPIVKKTVQELIFKWLPKPIE